MSIGKRLCLILALAPVLLWSQDQALDHAIAARKFFEQGDQKRALMAYSKAIELDQVKPEYYYERGRVKRHIGKPGAAAVDFEIAVTFDQKFNDAWFQLGLASYEASRFDDALRALNMTLFNDSKNAEAWHWRGCTLTSMGREESAIRSLIQATRMNPKSTHGLLSLGRAYARTDKLQEAVLAFSKAIALEAKNPELHHARALAQLQYAAAAPQPQTFLAAAAADLAEARATSPADPELRAMAALHKWLTKNAGAAVIPLAEDIKRVPQRHASQLQLRAWAVATAAGDDKMAASFQKALSQNGVAGGASRWIDIACAKRAPNTDPRTRVSVDDQQTFAFYAGMKALGTGNTDLAKRWLGKAAERGHSFEGLAAKLVLKKLTAK